MMPLTVESVFGALIYMIFIALAGYYYAVARSNLSKLFVVITLILSINRILGSFVYPIDPNIFFYAFQSLDIICSVVVAFLFYELYKDSVSKSVNLDG